MGIVKKLLRPRVIAWAVTTVVLAGVLIAANAVAVGKYGTLIDRVFGGKKAITAERNKEDSIQTENNSHKLTCKRIKPDSSENHNEEQHYRLNS